MVFDLEIDKFFFMNLYIFKETEKHVTAKPNYSYYSGTKIKHKHANINSFI